MTTELTRDELLDVLVEEAAEIIHAASKIRRWGWGGSHPEYGPNYIALSGEIGDFLGVLAALKVHLDSNVENRAAEKLDKVKHMKDAHLTRIASGEGHATP